MTAVQLLLFDFLYTTQVSGFSCSQDCATCYRIPGLRLTDSVEPMPTRAPTPTPSSPTGRTDCRKACVAEWVLQ